MDSNFQVAYITSVEEYSDNRSENPFENQFYLKVKGFTVDNGEVKALTFLKGYEGDKFYYKTPFDDMVGDRNSFDNVVIVAKRMFSNMNEHFVHIAFAPAATLHIVDEGFFADYTVTGGENVAKAMSELYSAETYKDKQIFQQSVIASSQEFQKRHYALEHDVRTIQKHLEKGKGCKPLHFANNLENETEKDR